MRLVAVLGLSMPVVGYVIGGLPSAAFFLVMALLSNGLTIRWERRFWGP
jgi:hypothetical protein